MSSPKNACVGGYSQASAKTEEASFPVVFGHLSNLSRKFTLGSKPPLFTWIARTDLGTRLRWGGGELGGGTVSKLSLRKHPFLLTLRRWGRFARRNVGHLATEIPY